MPEITPDDLKWLEKLDGRIWEASLDLDGLRDQWTVGVALPATACFAVRGEYEDKEQRADPATMQEILNGYTAIGLACVDAKKLRTAIRSVNTKANKTIDVDLILEYGKDIQVVGYGEAFRYKAREEATITAQKSVTPYAVHPETVSFQTEPRMWINALNGFTGDVWIMVRPTPSGHMFVIHQNGDRIAFIMGFISRDPHPFIDYSRDFWDHYTRKAIKSTRGLKVMDYGELIELSKSVDLDPYFNTNCTPETATKEIVAKAEAEWVEKVSQISVGDLVTVCWLRSARLIVTNIGTLQSGDDYAELTEEDGKPHYPVTRHNLRKLDK